MLIIPLLEDNENDKREWITWENRYYSVLLKTRIFGLSSILEFHETVQLITVLKPLKVKSGSFEFYRFSVNKVSLGINLTLFVHRVSHMDPIIHQSVGLGEEGSTFRWTQDQEQYSTGQLCSNGKKKVIGTTTQTTSPSLVVGTGTSGIVL